MIIIGLFSFIFELLSADSDESGSIIDRISNKAGEMMATAQTKACKAEEEHENCAAIVKSYSDEKLISTINNKSNSLMLRATANQEYSLRHGND